MKKKITKKMKRRLTILSTVILILIVTIITSIFNDLRQIINNKNEYAVLTEKYNDLLEEEESLQSEITKLQDSDYVARYAREKFSYSKEDEVIITLPDD